MHTCYISHENLRFVLSVFGKNFEIELPLMVTAGEKTCI